jgi:perosamine synthetase
MSLAGPAATRTIPVYKPHFTGREREYVLDCIDTGWISSRGAYVDRFEKACGEAIGDGHVNAVFNGTVALHLALAVLGVGPGDEVIVPTLTYVASVNAIRYVGATPVFCECDRATWQMDPTDIARRITSKTRAIMAVHLYGQPAPMREIMELAARHRLVVVEDAAEALGSRIGSQHVGTFGDTATFSFFANKTITTGEGGVVVARRKEHHDEIALLKAQYASNEKRYWHNKLGYNYRMTNIQAAIGLAQIEGLASIVARKRAIAAGYAKHLAHLPYEHHSEASGTTHNFWMCSILVPCSADRDRLAAHLASRGIETRPVFYPVHTMPMYVETARGQRFPVSEDIAARGLNLPSYPDLSEDDLAYICDAISAFKRS